MHTAAASTGTSNIGSPEVVESDFAMGLAKKESQCGAAGEWARVTAGQWRDDGGDKPVAWYAAALKETQLRLAALELLAGSDSHCEVLRRRDQINALTAAGTRVYLAAFDVEGT